MLRTWARRFSISAGLIVGLLAAANPSHATTAPLDQVGAVAVITVTVQQDDTAWGLAGRYCASPTLYKSITVRSPLGQLRDLAHIWPGDKARIPCARTGSGAPIPTQSAPTPAGWVQPLAGRYCGSKATAGWGAPRVGHRHQGVDIGAPYNTPIRAVRAGTVALVKAQRNSRGALTGGGYYVMIDHGGRVYTVYMHLIRQSHLTVGARVATGQTVGYVGSSGTSSGPHLHFEVHSGGKWDPHRVNPSPFMAARGVRVGC